MRQRPPSVEWHRRVIWYVYAALNVPPHTASTRSAYQTCVGQRSDDHVQQNRQSRRRRASRALRPYAAALRRVVLRGCFSWAIAEQDLCQPVCSAWLGDKQWKNQAGHAHRRGGRCPAPALGDEAGCRDSDICRPLDRRGGELPCPRTAGAAAVPTHEHPSGRRTSRAWNMCGGTMCCRGSTMTDHSVYVVRAAASTFAGFALWS